MTAYSSKRLLLSYDPCQKDITETASIAGLEKVEMSCHLWSAAYVGSVETQDLWGISATKAKEEGMRAGMILTEPVISVYISLTYSYIIIPYLEY